MCERCMQSFTCWIVLIIFGRPMHFSVQDLFVTCFKFRS